MIEFKSFDKIPRSEKVVCTITEKIDGTNGIIHITDDGVVYAGSRRRWLVNDGSKAWDNYGFGAWVAEHSYELVKLLGPGRHVGEWWGQGIQRGYDLTRKRFSLFHPLRYPHIPTLDDGSLVTKVPVVFSAPMPVDVASVVAKQAELLLSFGSCAAPGYPLPEGLVINIGSQPMKVILNHSDKPRSRDGL